MPAIPPDRALCLECFEYRSSIEFDKVIQSTRSGITRSWIRELFVWEGNNTVYKQHRWKAPTDDNRQGNFALGQCCSKCKDEDVYSLRSELTEREREQWSRNKKRKEVENESSAPESH